MTHSDKQVSDHHRLNKTLFAAGMQCAKRLYQEFHEPDSVPAPNEIRDKLSENIREARLLRQLLKLSEQRIAVEEARQK